MKLRCVHNSIRIRVRKSDLVQLKEQSKVAETLNFGGVVFSFEINIQKGIQQMTSTFLDGKVIVKIPTIQFENWFSTDQVGLENQDGLVHILVEKDFPCKDRDEENKADTFWELSEEESAC